MQISKQNYILLYSILYLFNIGIVYSYKNLYISSTSYLKNCKYFIGWQLKFCILFVTHSKTIRIITMKVDKTGLKFTKLLINLCSRYWDGFSLSCGGSLSFSQQQKKLCSTVLGATQLLRMDEG